MTVSGEAAPVRRAGMTTTTSRDGTTIAFDRTGHGPPVIIVAGGL